jgi:hypothetical protein
MITHYVDDAREKAQAMLAQVDAVEQLPRELPGRFIFSPPDNNRLEVETLAELHEARAILRERFGWKDEIRSKFYSCGLVIVVYAPAEDVQLPLPFELWVSAPPESFPKELLGDCVLQPIEPESRYTIVCPT